MNRRLTTVALLVLGLAISSSLAACGADDVSRPLTTSTDGEELFSMRALGGQPGCVTCHSFTPDRTLVGPSLAGISVRAEERVPELEADEYLRASILEPSSYVVDGFDADEMPAEFGQLLSERQLDALVDYLLEID